MAALSSNPPYFPPSLQIQSQPHQYNIQKMAALSSSPPYFPPSLQIQSQPKQPHQYNIQKMAALSSNPPYFSPSLQIQSQPQLPCIAMDGHDDDDDDDVLLNLAAAAAAVTCGYNFNYDSMLLDPNPFLDTNYYQQQQQSNHCLSQSPECYCYLPSFHGHNHHHHMEQLLQLPSFHDQVEGFDSNYILHHHDKQQKIHALNVLNSSSFHLEPEAAAAAEASMSIRKISSVNNNDGDRKRVTAQSMAARERRRKITKKTQELGKLVPGGSKMNTAEMLHSAFKYIKFLQSQLQLLQLMSSFPDIQGDGEEKVLPLLHVVASPLVQEKLYMEERCIAPRAFAKTLLENTTDPSVSDELRELLID